MNSETILLTGATGFLGKHLADRIKSEYPGVHCILTSSHEEPELGILKLDLTDVESLKAYISSIHPDVVYHLGGLVDLSRSYDIARRCIENNLIGTMNLLESLKEHPPIKFVFSSTEEVYGTDFVPYREDQLTKPPSPYAITKLASEHMCRYYAKEWSIPSLVMRIGTMYGPAQPEHRYIATAILRALKHEPIPINSGLKKRDYIFVDDVVDALVCVLQHRHKSMYDTVNIGSGVSMSLKQFVETIIDLTESTSQVEFGEIPERISEPAEWRMDVRKAKRLLEWTPKTGIREGLEKTIAYYRTLL